MRFKNTVNHIFRDDIHFFIICHCASTDRLLNEDCVNEHVTATRPLMHRSSRPGCIAREDIDMPVFRTMHDILTFELTGETPRYSGRWRGHRGHRGTAGCGDFSRATSLGGLGDRGGLREVTASARWALSLV